MKIINAEEVESILTEKNCIPVMEKALSSLEEGRGTQFLRTPHKLPGGIFAFMPASLGDDYFGAKVITVFHGNAGTAYPSHQGMVLLFDAQHGNPVAFIDAASITKIRTGAVSAAATDILARKDAHHLALLGAGTQAISHLRAIREVRPLSLVTVWDKDGGRSEDFCLRMAAETGLSVQTRPTAQEALEDADIICTLTPSHTPVLEAAWVKEGAHINAVGACLPADRELPSDLVQKARFFGDSRESVLKESGDFLIPLAEGLFGEEHLLGTLGGLLLGHVQGRQSGTDITIFEALGLAIEDIAAAVYIYSMAA